MPLRVLIIGSGIAGPSLAFWLSRIGCTITIIERSPSARHTGQQIDIRGFGVDVMRRMGIEPAIRERLAHEPGTLLVDGAGRRRAYFPTRHEGRGDSSISSEFEIMRGGLCEILEGLTKGREDQQVVYKYGVTLREITGWDDAEGVKVVLEGEENGKEQRFDLVIGCDGTRSPTRKMILTGTEPDVFHTLGATVAWVTVPTEEGDTNDFTWYLAPGERLLCTRMDRADCLRVLFMTGPLPEDHPIRKTLRSGNTAEQRKAWADHFRDAGWKAERFTTEVARSELAADFHAAEMGHVKMDRWFRGRVAVLGDAAYCAPPAGWGTAMALVGAYVLAGEIARHCGLSGEGKGIGEDGLEKARQAVPEALKAYDETLRPLITKVQKASGAGRGLPSSKFAISATLTTMSLVQTLRLDKLMMRLATGGGTDFGWKLPEYKELGRLDQ